MERLRGRRTARALVLAGAVLLVTTAVGCAPGAAGPGVTTGGLKGEGTSNVAPAPPAAPGAKPAAAPAPAVAADAVAQRGAPAASGPEAAAASARVLDRMVIRNVRLALQVEDVQRAVGTINEIARGGGGFVSQSSTRTEKLNGREVMFADLTLQVRSEQLEQVLVALKDAALKVDSEVSTSQDVTEEYVDLDANLRNLQASEQAILKLMERAQKIEDIIALQRELTNVRGQIERIQGRKTLLERRTDLATIVLSLRTPPVEVSVSPQGWDPALVARRGWEASLATLVAIASVLIATIAYSWWLAPVALAGWYVARRWRRPRRAATAAA